MQISHVQTKKYLSMEKDDFIIMMCPANRRMCAGKRMDLSAVPAFDASRRRAPDPELITSFNFKEEAT